MEGLLGRAARCASEGSQWHCWRTGGQGAEAHTGVKGFFFETNWGAETPGITAGLYRGGKVEEMP